MTAKPLAGNHRVGHREGSAVVDHRGPHRPIGPLRRRHASETEFSAGTGRLWAAFRRPRGKVPQRRHRRSGSTAAKGKRVPIRTRRPRLLLQPQPQLLGQGATSFAEAVRADAGLLSVPARRRPPGSAAYDRPRPTRRPGRARPRAPRSAAACRPFYSRIGRLGVTVHLPDAGGIARARSQGHHHSRAERRGQTVRGRLRCAGQSAVQTD